MRLDDWNMSKYDGDIEYKARDSRRLEVLEREREVWEPGQEGRVAAEGRFVPYSEHVALRHPTPTRAWREDSSDAVLGRGSRFTDMP